MLHPQATTQLTPWTRPNVSGYTLYPPGFEPNWFAIDGVRYTGAADSTMAFDFYADFRTAPEVVIRADSWMGQETATSSGGTAYAFTSPVRLTDGAQLRVWDNATITFAAGLTVEDGAELICETGSTCIIEDHDSGAPALATGAGSCIRAEDGSTVHVQGTLRTTSGGFFANLTGGTFALGAGAQLTAEASSSAPVVQPEATFALGSAASIDLEGSVDLVGTALSPVRFERLSSAAKWGEVSVLGDGSTLRHVVLDGGEGNLRVAADDVALDYVTSRNGDHGLRTDFEADGTRSTNLVVTNSVFEDAAYYGISFYFANARVTDTVVQGSGWHNVNVFVANVHGFASNTVEDGADAGIAVHDEGTLSFSAASPGPGSRNRVQNNGNHEVYVGLGGSAFLGGDTFLPKKPGSQHAPNAGACNAITSTGGASGSKLVYNATGQTVYALFNYWGSGFLSPSDTYGPVDRTYHLAADPTAGGACVAGPSALTTGTPEASAGETTPPGDGASAAEVKAWADQMDALRARLAEQPTADAVATLFALLQTDVADAAGRRGLNVAAFVATAGAGPAPLGHGSSSAGRAGRETAELAALSLARDALARDEVARARRLFTPLRSALATPRHQRAALAFESALSTAEGRLAEALAALVAYEAAEGAHALVTEGYQPSDLSYFRERLAAAVAASSDASSGKAPMAAEASSVQGAALVTGLDAPYPNPSRAGVTVSLTLAEAGRAEVAVYDVTGRRVATLATGERAEGRHALSLDGSGLAPGVYLVQAMVESGTETASFTRRFTVIR